MRIALVCGNFPPASLSGTAMTVASMARALSRNGHRVVVMVTEGEDGGVDAGMPAQGDFKVLRGLHTAGRLRIAVEEVSPDVVLATGRKAPEQLAGLPGGFCRLLYLQDAMSGLSGLGAGMIDGLVFGSNFLRDHYRESFGASGDVIRPLVEKAGYAEIRSSRSKVVFFGLSTIKRPDIMYRIARRLKTVEFVVFHTWGARYKLRNLPLILRRNITLRAPVQDPAAIYRDARVILVCSDTEGWCRVVTEAQFAGIPAIARNIAALPESVGKGGILLARDASDDQWSDAVSRVFDDETYYDNLVAATRNDAERDIVSPEFIAGQWEVLLQKQVSKMGRPA